MTGFLRLLGIIFGVVYPTALALVAAYNLGSRFLSGRGISLVSASAGAFGISGVMAGLCFAGAAALDPASDGPRRGRLAKAGALLTVGSSLFVGAAVVRYSIDVGSAPVGPDGDGPNRYRSLIFFGVEFPGLLGVIAAACGYCIMLHALVSLAVEDSPRRGG